MLPNAITPSILLVDTNSVLRRLFALYISGKGFKVATADGMRTALELLTDDDFDVVITDTDLPGVSEHELLDTIKTADRSLKVILLRDKTKDQNYYLLRGAMETLAKPFSKKELAVKLDMVMHERRRSIRFGTTDVFCTLRGRHGGSIKGLLSNISFDGASISADAVPQSRTDIEVEFLAPDTGRPLGAVFGTVMRVQEKAGDFVCSVGVLFHGHGQLDIIDRLAPYVKDRL